MKKIIIGLLALMVLAGGITAAKVLAQEFMQVSPRTWVLGSSGIEPIDIHLAVPLKSIVDRNTVGVEVYYFGEVTDDSLDNKVEVVIDEPISIGADSRGDLVIKFVPALDGNLIGKSLFVEVTGIDDLIDEENGEYTIFEGVEVKENPLFVETVVESVVTFFSSIGNK
jgi:hypothetical protein